MLCWNVPDQTAAMLFPTMKSSYKPSLEVALAVFRGIVTLVCLRMGLSSSFLFGFGFAASPLRLFNVYRKMGLPIGITASEAVEAVRPSEGASQLSSTLSPSTSTRSVGSRFTSSKSNSYPDGAKEERDCHCRDTRPVVRGGVFLGDIPVGVYGYTSPNRRETRSKHGVGPESGPQRGIGCIG